MTNLVIELLLLILVLVNFAGILTANIYSQSLKKFSERDNFVENL